MTNRETSMSNQSILVTLSSGNAARYLNAYRMGTVIAHPKVLGKFIKVKDFYPAYGEEDNTPVYGIKFEEVDPPEPFHHGKVRISVTGGVHGSDTAVQVFDSLGKRIELNVAALQLNMKAGSLNEAVLTLHNVKLDINSEFLAQLPE